MLFQERQLGLLRLRLVGRIHGHVVERDTVKTGQVPRGRVVADDEGDVAAQLSDGVAVEQVQQAMLVLGNENRGGGPGHRIGQPPLHLKAVGQGLEALAERRVVQREIRQVPLDAHEEQAQIVVLVLIGV